MRPDIGQTLHLIIGVSVADVCGVCQEESDFPLCWKCLGKLRGIIQALRDVAKELQTQVTRQNVGAPAVRAREGYDWVLPFDLAASDSAHDVLSALARWFVPEDGSILKPFSQNTTQGRSEWFADWLLCEYVRMGRLETGPSMYRNLDAVLAHALMVIDRKVCRVWLGDCECGRAVRAFPDKVTVLCHCGVVWDVQASRLKLKELGAEQVVSGADAESLGEIFGARIKQSTVRVWRHRGKLLCLNLDCDMVCKHIYRFGDILELHGAERKL